MKICDFIGHKFRPRYDSTMPAGRVDGSLLVALGADEFKNKTYHHDICERCGLIAGRKDQP